MKNFKQYHIYKSPLYKLKSLNQVNRLLDCCALLDKYKSNSKFDIDSYYNKSENLEREIHYPINILQELHSKLNVFLSRIEKPPYLKSGVKNQSYVSHASTHLMQNNLLALDIKSYYTHITKIKVFKFFRNTLSCSHQVSDFFAYICTYNGYLPVGSSLSMNLAYLINQEMFDKLYNISIQNQLIMTIYVDDIVFSGSNISSLFKYNVIGIINKYGYDINKKKTKLYKKKNSPREINGLILVKDKLFLPTPKKEKLHLMLMDWKKIINNNSAYSLKLMHEKYIKLIGLISHFCQFDNKYISLKRKVIKEYKMIKIQHLYNIFKNEYSIWELMLSSREGNNQEINSKKHELIQIVTILAKLDKRYNLLFKELNKKHLEYKNKSKERNALSFTALSNIFLKHFS